MNLRTTKDGLFQYSEDSRESGETSFRELSDTENERVMARVSEVHFLLDRYLPGQSEQGISPRVLDQLFIKWLGDSLPEKTDEKSIATVLGSTFAYLLQVQKQMVLLVARANGEEPTLAVSNRAIGLTIYPIAAVEKRIETRSAGFFEPIFAVVEEKLNELLH
ncbi:MAG: hypothetical protein ABL877_07550 [Thiobacillus sp.]